MFFKKVGIDEVRCGDSSYTGYSKVCVLRDRGQ